MPDLLDPTIYPTYGSASVPSWDNVLKDAQTGIAQVRQWRTTPRWLTSYVWRGLPSYLYPLEDFFRTQKGPATSFYHYSASPWQYWEDVTVGTGDASTRGFAFPGRYFEADVVTVAGTTKTKGTDYEIGIENRIKQSDTLSDAAEWAVVASTIALRVGGQADPLGGTQAWNLTLSVANPADVPTLSNFPGFENSTGVARRGSVWIRNTGGNPMIVRWVIGGVNYDTNVAVGAGWTEIVGNGTTAGAVLGGVVFFATAANSAISFDVWHPSIVEAASYFPTNLATWGFIPTGATAIVASSLGKHVVSFYSGSIPAAAAAILIDYRGWRLLLGRLRSDISGPRPVGYKMHEISASCEGVEQ